jgi:Fe-S-cluster containining protein
MTIHEPYFVQSREADEKQRVLKRIFAVYETCCGQISVACHRGCDTCCTRNVTLTTLEGRYILEHLDSETRSRMLARVLESVQQPRFQPAVTSNDMAARCLRDEDLPEEIIEASWGACPLLEAHACAIYALRPMGCRLMLSTIDCKQYGSAEMDPFMVTVGHVFLQTIEHVDAAGKTGNLTDILLYLAGKGAQASENLLKNRLMPALMVPPEHRNRLAPILSALRRI